VDAKRNGIDEVEIWGTGRPVREWMYVEDAAAGILRATELYNDLEILNLGCGHGCSIRELAEIVRTEAGWAGSFVYDPQRPDGAPCKILDVKKMKQVLQGWTPPTGLRAGIRRTLAWLLQHDEESHAVAAHTPVVRAERLELSRCTPK
jgi:GDP-L-fucose synthase